MTMRLAYPAPEAEADTPTCDWSRPPDGVVLQHDAIDLWLIDLDGAPAHNSERLLDAAERERAAGFRRAIDARRFMHGRATLRRVLAQYVHDDAAALPLATGPNGKPVLASGPAFNLSHSGARALVAVCGRATVGLDLEQVRQMANASELAARFFTQQEAAAIGAASGLRRDALFFRCWTRKEAVLKALGDGLQRDTTSVDAGLGATERVVALAGAPRLVVRSFTPEAGWDAAFAVAGEAHEPALRPRCFDAALLDDGN